METCALIHVICLKLVISASVEVAGGVHDNDGDHNADDGDVPLVPDQGENHEEGDGGLGEGGHELGDGDRGRVVGESQGGEGEAGHVDENDHGGEDGGGGSDAHVHRDVRGLHLAFLRRGNDRDNLVDEPTAQAGEEVD